MNNNRRHNVGDRRSYYIVTTVNHYPILYLAITDEGELGMAYTEEDALKRYTKGLIEQKLNMFLLGMPDDEREHYVVVHKEYIVI